MSIAAVCVDRGRVLRKEVATVRVEGRSSFVPVPEQWFKARLFLADSADTIDPQGGHVTSVSSPQVLTVAKDLDGQPLAFQGDFVIEVNSAQFGRYTWTMRGEPNPLRKKRRVIGWVLNVERVIERAYEDLLNENVPAIYAPAL